ncbi:ribonuclease BN [gamma proteobacterium NOR5-3]|nr:ribonuclease BN [gamma proteobacterium NOR5-3]
MGSGHRHQAMRFQSNNKQLEFFWTVLKQSAARFTQEEVLNRSAALAFYMMFSLPPMLLIMLWTAGSIHDEAAVNEAICAEIGKLVGEDGARQLMTTVEGLRLEEPSWWATLIGVGTLVFSASTVLITMQDALNRIFGAPRTEGGKLGLWRMLRDHVLSGAMLATIGLILSVSLAVNALISALGRLLERWLGPVASWLLALDFVLVKLAGFTILFALLFRYLPDVRIARKDTWFGALLTAGLFGAERQKRVPWGGEKPASLPTVLGRSPSQAGKVCRVKTLRPCLGDRERCGSSPGSARNHDARHSVEPTGDHAPLVSGSLLDVTELRQAIQLVFGRTGQYHPTLGVAFDQGGGNSDFSIAHAQKTADRDHGHRDFGLRADNKIVEPADLLSLVVVNVRSQQLGRPVTGGGHDFHAHREDGIAHDRGADLFLRFRLRAYRGRHADCQRARHYYPHRFHHLTSLDIAVRKPASPSRNDLLS